MQVQAIYLATMLWQPLGLAFHLVQVVLDPVCVILAQQVTQWNEARLLRRLTVGVWLGLMCVPAHL